ncbi:unnamed protein product [Diatraea saccharalis]|uniref:Resistance to inhibitors of cholinesterase protein 3 N-terminal domain-containing protein n=1 Tax=Diatraea saccharalis TaxID=40085 RepID=A0A9N9RFZ1_9NEOP|nr:unnamed protein product [Diatraea saccharalis]
MANEEVLGPRKTMFVLVIVVGCFAVLWPRILSPLILGHTREQLKPNQFDREAGCCEVMFETEVALLELLNEVCSSVVHTDGKLSPYAAAECRKTVNETCGVDIAAFIKRDENVGKTTKKLLEMMKTSNSSCLKEHFGVPQWTISNHVALNSWTLQDTVKQERPPMRAGPHPALRERGRAIPPGVPPSTRSSVTMPPHVRVRSSPLDVYFEIDIKPPPLPGVRPPLGSPGGPVAAPKSSMGFVMPIYTICIIIFFVYTLSKILFKRTGAPVYDPIVPDPQFRRRVFRDDSRTSPDKLVVTAISGLVAEVQQQMEASYAQNQQRQDLQDNHARPYTNGTVLHNTGPVQIVASEYREKSKEKSPEPPKEPSAELKEAESQESISEPELCTSEVHEDISDQTELITEPKESTPEPKESTPEPKESTPEPKVPTPKPLEPEPNHPNPESKEAQLDESVPESEPRENAQESKEFPHELEELNVNSRDLLLELEEDDHSDRMILEHNELKTKEPVEFNHKNANIDLIKLTENIESIKDTVTKSVEDFLDDAKTDANSQEHKQSTPELLEEALKEGSSEKETENEEEEEKAAVKVVGMELTAHTADGGEWRPPLPAPAPAPAPRPHVAEEVKAIYLEGEIPQQSRVLVTEFEDSAQDKPPTKKHSPTVVSGKMTLSLIQDAPKDTPERDLESTVDDFTTASAITQPAEEKEEESEDEVEEEIEVEEIEEEVEEEEEEEEPLKQEAVPQVPSKEQEAGEEK